MLGRWFGRMFLLDWRVIGAAIALAGILHICTSFVAESLVSETAYDTLTNELELNQIKVMPPVTAQYQPLPFMAPDARYALCRYSTADGPVRITASLPRPGWALSLFDERGANYLTAVAGVDRPRDIDILLTPRVTQGLIGGSEPVRGDRLSRAQLRQQSTRGLLVIRAPDHGTAYRVKNLAILKTARCSKVR